MTYRARLACAAFVIACVPLTARGRQDQPPTFRASADLVSVDVAVRRAGRPVTDLKKEEFEILDNGVAQDITDLTYGTLPIDVTVALDVSASVTGAVLEDLRRSVQELAKDLHPSDRLKLVTFNMRVRRVMDFSADAAPRIAAIRLSSGSGSTAALDTIAVALAAPAPPDRRRLVMLFTDGADTSSITDPRTLLDLAQRTTPTVGIVLAPPRGVPITSAPGNRGPAVTITLPPPTLPADFRWTYDALARETGGVVAVATSYELASTLRRVLDEFRSSYVLHFVPAGVDRGGFHPLSVRIRRPGIFDVRARSGYSWR